MIGYWQIATVAGFLIIVIIAIIILTLKRVREKKAEERKEKRLRGEPVDDKKNGEPGKILEYFKNSYGYIPLIIGYIVFLTIFSKAFPDVWKDWRGSNLFLLSQVAIILSLWLFTLKNKMGKFMAVAISLLLLTIVGFSNWPWWESSPNGNGQESSYGQAQQEERIEFYGNRLVQVGHEWSAEYGANDGGTMRIKRVDPSIPLQYLLTKLNDTKEIVDIPAVHEGYGDIKIPDYKRLRIKASKETTVWIITKPL